MKKIFLSFLVLACSSSFANKYELNKTHSHVNFEVEYMSLTKVEGQFKDYMATFEYDDQKKILSKIEATIVAKSVDTNEPKRDFHLKSHEFLFADNYPELKFSSEGLISVKEKKSVKVNGVLTIRGIKKTVTGDLIFRGHLVDPWGKENLFFDYVTTINRQDFGMKWNKELDQGGYLVGDKVKIILAIQAQKSGEKTAFSTHMIPSTKAIVERDQLKKGKIKKLSTSTDPKDSK